MSKNIPISNPGLPILESQKHPAGYLTKHCCRRMREERIKNHLTQQELADLVQVSLDTIKRYETGETKYLRLDFVCDVASVLHVPLQAFLPPQSDNIESRLQRLESKLAAIRDIIASK